MSDIALLKLTRIPRCGPSDEPVYEITMRGERLFAPLIEAARESVGTHPGLIRMTFLGENERPFSHLFQPSAMSERILELYNRLVA